MELQVTYRVFKMVYYKLLFCRWWGLWLFPTEAPSFKVILSCLACTTTNLHFMTFYGIPTHLVVWWPVAIRHFVLCHLMILFIIIVVPTFKYVTAIRVSHRRHKLLPSNSIGFYLIETKYWKKTVLSCLKLNSST